MPFGFINALEPFQRAANDVAQIFSMKDRLSYEKNSPEFLYTELARCIPS